MKEIYRSFDGKLNVDQQDGYILYSTDDGGALIEYEGLSVWQDVRTERARIPADHLPPEQYGDTERIGELVADCWCGNLAAGQIYFCGKWWSGDKIREIQRKNNDLQWQRYV